MDYRQVRTRDVHTRFSSFTKYYVRTYSLVKRLYPTFAGRAMLIINKDSCIV
jgi:hypothetical protein